MKIMQGLFAVAVIATSMQSAFAYWDTGVDTVNKSGVNDGEAMLTIWDAIGNRSYSQDLGVRYSALYNGSAFNGQTISLDSTALSVFGTANFNDLQWNIVAANSHVKDGTSNAYTGAGYILSYESSVVKTAPAGIGTNVNTTWVYINPYQTNLALNNPADTTMVRSGTASYGNGAGYQGVFINFIASNELQDWDFIDGGSNTMNLWFTGFGNAAGTQAGSTATNLGTATLNLNTQTLTLGVSSTPQVPIPAAAWLMASALLGLGGFKRMPKL